MERVSSGNVHKAEFTNYGEWAFGGLPTVKILRSNQELPLKREIVCEIATKTSSRDELSYPK